eukprot:11653879-Alexandrium_andersonii.AAC.1
MVWEDGELSVKSAQGHSDQMTYFVDLHQTVPVIQPKDPRWARVAEHGARISAVPLTVQNGMGNRLARGGRGTYRTHYHVVKRLMPGQQAGLRSGSGAVV